MSHLAKFYGFHIENPHCVLIGDCSSSVRREEIYTYIQKCIPVAIIGGIGMTITALFGMKWMSKLSDIAVPLVLIFGIISIVLSVKKTGGLSGLFSIRPDNPSSFNELVSLAIATGYSDITYVLASQGLLAPAFIVMILNIWSTAQGCVYSGSLSLGNTISTKRTYLVLGFGLAGTIGAVVGFYNYFFLRRWFYS